MRAMILAAGLGTRLRPLTDTRPKALVQLNGRTLLGITLTRLKAFGIRDVIINVHHFADMVVEYLKANKDFGLRIGISREDVLLDTGGGLKKASWFFLEDKGSADDRFFFTTLTVSVQSILAAWCNFTRRTRRLLLWPCRTGRRAGISCLTTSCSSAAGAKVARV